MASVELNLPKGIASQFDVGNEISTITRDPEQTYSNLVHVYAEHIEQVTVASFGFYHLPEQKQKLIETSKKGITISSPISRLRHQKGFIPLLNKIEATKKPAFGVLVSPPDTDLGETYAFIYLYDISLNGDDQEVRNFYVRIDPYNENIGDRLLDLFSQWGGIREQRNSITETLTVNPFVLEKGSQVALPGISEKGVHLETMSDLLAVFQTYLPNQINDQDIDKAINGQSLATIENQYHQEIQTIFNILKQMAATRLSEADKQRFNHIMTDRFSYVNGGSCCSVASEAGNSLLSKVFDNKDSKEIKEDKETPHWCPICQSFFKGFVCHCGYKISTKEEFK